MSDGPTLRPQMEFNEKELRREISYAIKNIHGIRQVTHVFLVFRRPAPRRRVFVGGGDVASALSGPRGGAPSGNPGLGSAVIARAVLLGLFRLKNQKRFCTPGTVLARSGTLVFQSPPSQGRGPACS